MLIAGRSVQTPVSSAEPGVAIDVVTGKPFYSKVAHFVAAASNNAAVIATGPGIVSAVEISNAAASFQYVKLYDKASAPNPATDTPLMIFGCPPSWARDAVLQNPVPFKNGLAILIVGGVADTDNSSAAPNGLAADVHYLT